MKPRVLLKKCLLAASILVFAAGVVLSTWKASGYSYRPYLHDDLYLPSGKFINELSLGYKQLVADFIWLSTVQYYGDYRMGNHDLLYFKGLIEIATMLDPHFVFAYIFGALVTSEDEGQFDMGMDLLKQGMLKNPDSWQLPFEIGFLHYIDKADYEMAARYFELAAKMPGSPSMARRFAAFVYSKAGHEENSIKMWEELKRQAKEPFMRELAEHYLQKLKKQQADKEKELDIDG
jgi:tetratricopeptide (TPR) repeat protein